MDKFVEEAKRRLMYERESGNDDVSLMLDYGGVNTRLNEEMGKCKISFNGVVSCWSGAWNENFKGLFDDLERFYLGLNGYARVQAIEMRGQSAIAEREVMEKKERSGILGLFSGGK